MVQACKLHPLHRSLQAAQLSPSSSLLVFRSPSWPSAAPLLNVWGLDSPLSAEFIIPPPVCVCVCVCVCKRQRQRQRQRERDAVLGPPPQLACSGLLLTSLAKGRTAHPAALWGAPSLSPPGGCRAASPLQSSPCLSAFLDSSSSHT